ncbi:class I SAM-dependent methyltransferase [Flindersiella endophytica]
MSETAFLTTTRAAYDTVAVSYAKLLEAELAGKPLDRAMLGAFAERVGPGALVADIGCGPGRVTGYLHGLGVDAYGIDLSPGMVEEARRRYPGLRFEVGSMTALDNLAAGSLAGVVAWYSVIHVPPASQPGVFAEFARVLAPGGQLLIAFQVGDEVRHLTEGYGHRIELNAYRLQPARIEQQLADAGLTVYARLVREPVEPERSPQAYLLARRSAA